MAGAATRPIRPVGERDDEPGVTDIVGSLLLVGITVLMAAGLGFLLLSFDGPADTQHTRLAVTIVPGAGSTWSDGNEELRIQHMGGERMARGETRIVYEQAGTRTELQDTALGSAFSDGDFRIGETWTLTLTVALSEAILVQVLGLQGDGATLLSSTTAVAGATASALCLGPDTVPPEVDDWDITPDDVDSTTAISDPPGSVLVTATLEDDCSGLSATMTPDLQWCVGNVCNAGAFGNATPMARVPSTDDWQATIPTQAWLTAALAGKTLWFQVHDIEDGASPANTAISDPQSEPIELVGDYDYVSTIVSTHAGGIGTLDTPVTNANSDLTSGVYTTMSEGATTGSTGSSSTTVDGTDATTIGTITLSPDPGAVTGASDSTYATGIDTNEGFSLDGFVPPGAAIDITDITIHVEARKSSGGKDPVFRLDHSTDDGANWDTGPATNIVTSTSADQTFTRSIDISPDMPKANVQGNLAVRIVMTGYSGSGQDRQLEVDRMWVTLQYTTAAATVYKLDMQADIPNVGSGTVHFLEGIHQRTVDTYDVFVFDHTALTWRDCDDLDGSPSGFTCQLQENINPLIDDEVSALGLVRVRFVDKDATNTSPGTLGLDYLRVSTV